MTAPSPHRNEYMRQYMKKRRLAQLSRRVDITDAPIVMLLDTYHDQTDLPLKVIVERALAAYLPPKVKQ